MVKKADSFKKASDKVETKPKKQGANLVKVITDEISAKVGKVVEKILEPYVKWLEAHYGVEFEDLTEKDIKAIQEKEMIWQTLEEQRNRYL